MILLSLSKCSGLAALGRAWWTKLRAGLFHHLRYDEEIFLRRRSVLEDGVGNASVGDAVRALSHFYRNDRGHRLDTFDIDLRQLLDKGENGIELAAQMLNLVLGDRNARKLRDAAHGLGIDRHGNLLEPTKLGDPHSRAAFAAPTVRKQLLRRRPEASIYSCHGCPEPVQHPDLRQPY